MNPCLLEIENLDVSYGLVQVLRSVTVMARSRGITAIVGPNGAGKTTLLKGIMGYVRPLAGTVKFEGTGILGTSTHLIIEKGIGYVPQGQGVFPEMTTQENLEMGAYILRKDPRKVRGLMERAYRIFPKLKERHWQKAGTLSGGERQMLAIGRALMGEPKLILLDEPSLGLAPLVLQSVYRTIKEMKKQGVSIFLVEQNAVAALSVADDVSILDLGQIRAGGPKEEILAQSDLKKRYFGLS
ncbi:MAG TPA: ABC transporter ATP-binding protein [Thermodesulfobacteriota bacterium]|nr:ABC transporter ATP-binding protein [Thermodesulfobacteriota bacterium]